MRVRDLLAEGVKALFARADARREAVLLLRSVLDKSEAWLVAHADDTVAAPNAAAYRELVERRAGGEPIAYLTGTRGFHAIELRVTPNVLIPRAETEVLVDLALQRIPVDADCAVADLGTGSGAIALAIARQRPRARVVATDVSEAALEVARDNAARLKIGNVEFRQGAWCAALPAERFEVIASNPPYVAAGDPYLHEGDLRFEPPLALSPGTDALGAIRVIASQAKAHLATGGWLLFEHGIDQGAGVRGVLTGRGYRDVFTERDLEDRERVSGGQRA
jgi:release factor glutamine methyltransferase